MNFHNSKIMEFMGLIHVKSIGLRWGLTYEFSPLVINCYA